MKDRPTQTSLSLLERVAGGNDESACHTLVARYRGLVLSVAKTRHISPEDCEEVAQDVMLAAIRAIREERFDRQQGHFKVWLKSVAYHKVCDVLRRAGRKKTTGSLPAEDVPDPGLPPDKQFEQEFEIEWQKIAFQEALDTVRKEIAPSTYQAFSLLRQGLKAREVANLLGMTVGAVGTAKSRVLARVRGVLDTEGEGAPP